ncbi:FlgT C-terminal domain-containing protein [Leuconostoc mesenteroides]|uniref:FlgT C-terminal domain-containing protein n=1 Tax=Leuconostoc mesenteroides TaxID=1245 RepID=UPI003885F207
MAIEAKVIRIISNKAILIDAGWDSGVNKGDEFRIVQRGDEIFDPESGESLGFFDYIKIRLEVTEVFEMFSQLQLISRSSPISKSLSNMISQFSNISTNQIVTSYRDLPVDTDQIEPLNKPSEINKNILISDIAIKIEK